MTHIRNLFLAALVTLAGLTAPVAHADATLAVYQSADDVLDYALDHTDLLTDGDVIASSVWTSTGDIVLTNPAQGGDVLRAAGGGCGLRVMLSEPLGHPSPAATRLRPRNCTQSQQVSEP